MRILITNDDGIFAPGLKVLEEVAREISDDVWVIAPETDQSGKAHSLTLSDPLRLRDIDDRHFAVRGTPTDCVIMGVRNIMPEPPDLVLSGINRGSNIADDVTYSGTVAGAMEGTILGIRSIALSQAFGWGSSVAESYECARAHGANVIRKLVDAGIPDGILMNVNFPARPPNDVIGVEITVQGERNQDIMRIDERVDARGFPYFWIAYEPRRLEPSHETDMWALEKGAISVTPLRLDLTDHASRQRLAHAFR